MPRVEHADPVPEPAHGTADTPEGMAPRRTGKPRRSASAHDASRRLAMRVPLSTAAGALTQAPCSAPPPAANWRRRARWAGSASSGAVSARKTDASAVATLSASLARMVTAARVSPASAAATASGRDRRAAGMTSGTTEQEEPAGPLGRTTCHSRRRRSWSEKDRASERERERRRA